MGVKLQSSSGGSVEIAAPVTASNYVLTAPAVTANIGIDGPAFSANLASAQNITLINTWTKISLSSEEYDTNNCYDTTLYRFTPTTAGYYQINGAINYNQNGVLIVAIWKNGSEYKRGIQANGLVVAANVSSLVYFNGTSDYVELYGFVSVTGQINNPGVYTYFNGCLLRSA